MTPAEHLRHELAAARAQGKTFDSVWCRALIDSCLEDESGPDLRAWDAALTSQRKKWQAAYERSQRVIFPTLLEQTFEDMLAA